MIERDYIFRFWFPLRYDVKFFSRHFLYSYYFCPFYIFHYFASTLYILYNSVVVFYSTKRYLNLKRIVGIFVLHDLFFCSPIK